MGELTLPPPAGEPIRPDQITGPGVGQPATAQGLVGLPAITGPAHGEWYDSHRVTLWLGGQMYRRCVFLIAEKNERGRPTGDTHQIQVFAPLDDLPGAHAWIEANLDLVISWLTS